MKTFMFITGTTAMLILFSNGAMAQRNQILSGNGPNNVGGILGQAVGNAIQNEIQGGAGVSNRPGARNGNQRIGNGQYRIGSGANNRIGGNGNFGVGGFNGYSNNSVNNSQLNSRFRNNAIASLLLSQFPQASRILAPNGYSNRGAYYRDNDQYYYYPISNSGNQGLQQSSTLYQQQKQSTGVSSIAPVESVAIQFGGFAHTEELGNLLPAVVNDFCLDMHHNYSHNQNFSSAYREAYAMLTTARSLQQSLPSNDRDVVKQHLVSIDQKLHLVDRQTQGWTRDHARQVGELGLIAKEEMVSDIIHHMMYDAGISVEGHAPPDSADSDAVTGEVAPPPAGF